VSPYAKFGLYIQQGCPHIGEAVIHGVYLLPSFTFFLHNSTATTHLQNKWHGLSVLYECIKYTLVSHAVPLAVSWYLSTVCWFSC